MQDLSGGIILFLVLALGWHYFVFTKKPILGYTGYAFLIFFLIRGTLAILNSIFNILPLQKDAEAYHQTAITIADLITNGYFDNLFEGIILLKFIEPAYTLVLGIFYFVFGKNLLVGFILNTFIFSLTAFNVYRIGKYFFDHKGSSAAAIIFMLLPYSSLDSIYLHRDVVINYFLSEFFFRLLSITKKKHSIYQLIWLSVVTFYIGLLRRENLVILVLIIMILSIRSFFNKKKSFLTPIKLFSFIIIFLIISLLIYQNSEKWFLRSFIQLTSVESLQARVERLEPRSAYLVGQRYNSIFDIIKYAPIRAVYFMFSPFPWDIFKISQIIPFIEALIIGSTILFLLKALLEIKRKNSTFFWAVTTYLLLGIIGSGLIQSNSAAAQRHRTQFTFLIIAITLPYIYKSLLSRISLFGRIHPKHQYL